jgi:hypothetical protein
MTTAIFFASVTISLIFVIPTVASRYGPDVAGRFLEKGTRPDALILREWVEKNPNAARGYATPVLFPLDLLFMMSLTGFVLFGSTALAERIAVSPDKRFSQVWRYSASECSENTRRGVIRERTSLCLRPVEQTGGSLDRSHRPTQFPN